MSIYHSKYTTLPKHPSPLKKRKVTPFLVIYIYNTTHFLKKQPFFEKSAKSTYTFCVFAARNFFHGRQKIKLLNSCKQKVYNITFCCFLSHFLSKNRIFVLFLPHLYDKNAVFCHMQNVQKCIKGSQTGFCGVSAVDISKLLCYNYTRTVFTLIYYQNTDGENV